MKTSTELLPSEKEKLEREYRAAKLLKLVRSARSDFRDFVLFTKPDYQVNWHHEMLLSKLNDFAWGRIKRLILTMPPRHGKSELSSRRLPAYLLGINPDMQIIAAAYSDTLAKRFNRDVQRIMSEPIYRLVFPNTRLNIKNISTFSKGIALRNSEMFEIVDRKGVYRAAGRGAGITGQGAHVLIVDDILKNIKEARSKTIRDACWEWYGNDAYSRLEENGQILILQTRWHEDDLIGRLREQMDSDPQADQFEIVDFPAIKEDEDNPDDPRRIGEALWPSKKDLESLEKIKKTLGSMMFSALYQQRPQALEGNIVRREWIRQYMVLPSKFDEVIQSWDLTFDEGKDSDYVVGSVYGRLGANIYLIDQVRRQMNVIDQLKEITRMSERYPDALRKLVEKKANGAAVLTLLENKIMGLVPVVPSRSKLDRVDAVTPLYEAGNVWYPHPSIAPWIDGHLTEMLAFPNAKHDDRVDAESQALNYFSSKIDSFRRIEALASL